MVCAAISSGCQPVKDAGMNILCSLQQFRKSLLLQSGRLFAHPPVEHSHIHQKLLAKAAPQCRRLKLFPPTPSRSVESPASNRFCLRLQDTDRPETPDALKKYRQSRLHEPGKIFRHFSAYNDPVDREKAYGRVSELDGFLLSSSSCSKGVSHSSCQL